MPGKPNKVSAGYWVTVAAVLVIASLVIVAVAVRRATNAPAMERRLRAMLGPGADSLYLVRVGSSRLGIFSRTYLATGIEILPDSAAFRRRREAGAPVGERYAVQVASFQVSGISIPGLLRGRSLKAHRAVADSVLLEVYGDKTLRIPRDTSKRLPHEMFNRIPASIRLDTLLLENSEIRYSERAIDGARPGTIRFAKSRIGVYNLSNDTLGPAVPVVIDVSTLLAGSAPASVVFEYDFRAPNLNLSYQGSVRDLDAKRLNEMTVDLEGVRFEDGRLDSAWFKFRVRDNRGSGELQLRYRDLEAKFLDKTSGKGGLSEWLKTFVANTFVIKDHNRGDGDHTLRTASVRGFPRTGDMSIFTYVWFTLREGIFLTITGEPPATSPLAAKKTRKGNR